MTVPYRNDKVVTRLWSPYVTTLSQPCSFSQSHCNLAATFSIPSQGCHKVVTTLPQSCSIFTIPLQPCSHIVYSFTRLLPPCHNHAIISQAQPCDHNVMYVITLSQPCHNIITFSLPHRKHVTTLRQGYTYSFNDIHID